MSDPLAEAVDSVSSSQPAEVEPEESTTNPAVADGSVVAAVSASIITPNSDQVLVIDGQTFSNLIFSEEHDGFFAQDASGTQFLIKREFIEANGLFTEMTNFHAAPNRSNHSLEAEDAMLQGDSLTVASVSDQPPSADNEAIQSTASVPSQENNSSSETAASVEQPIASSSISLPVETRPSSDVNNLNNGADLNIQGQDVPPAKQNNKSTPGRSPKVDNRAGPSRASQQQQKQSPTKNTISSSNSNKATNLTPLHCNFGVKTNNQLVNSTKNYSKNLAKTKSSSLVWITPEVKNLNGNSSNEEGPLTTTIEISDNVDDDDELDEKTLNDSASAISNNGNVKVNTKPIRKLEAKKRPNEVPVSVQNNNVDSDADEGIESNPPPPKSKTNLPEGKSAAMGDGNVNKAGTSSRRSAQSSLKKDPTPGTSSTDQLDGAEQASRKRTRASIDSRNDTIEPVSPATTNPAASKPIRKNVSFEIDCFSNIQSLNELHPTNFKRYRQVAPDFSGYIRNPLEARPSRAKEVRTAAHFNDTVRKNLLIHTRIQSQLGPDEFKQSLPFVCAKCGLTSLSMRTQRDHRENCTTSDNKANMSRRNGRMSNSPTKTAMKARGVGTVATAEFESLASTANDTFYDSSDFDESDEESQSEDEEHTFMGFTEKNVVWAQTKLGLWPALIDKIFPLQRKLLVTLFDYPLRRNSFKVHMSVTTLYDEGFTKKKLWKETVQLLKAVSNAEKYMRSKCLDQNDVDIFKPSTSSELPNLPSRDEPQTSGEDGQEESPRVPSVQVESIKIMNFIKEGMVESHLCGVFKQAIESERHQSFVTQAALEHMNQTSFGPITDEEDQDALYEYCSALFKNNFSTDQVSDYVTYVLNVWIPEAILKATTKLYPVDWKEAEQIFNYHSTEQLKKIM